MSSTSTRSPYGMFYDKTAYFGGTKPPGFDGHFSDSVTYISNLSTVKAKGARAYFRVTKDPRQSADSNSKFSLTMWKARFDEARVHATAAQMHAFVADGTAAGHMLIDDAQAGSSLFAGGVPTGLQIDQMAEYSKSHWSQVPCGVRMLGTYMKTIAPASGYTYLDFAWAQWVERFGAVQPFYQNNVNDARSVKLGCMAAFNLLNGGSGITPPWNQHPSQAIRFGMSPQEIDACGNAFSAITSFIGIIGWAHEPFGGAGSSYHDSVSTSLARAFGFAIGREAGPTNWRDISGSTSGSTTTQGGGWGLTYGSSYRATGPTIPVPLPGGIQAGQMVGSLLYSRDNTQRSATVPSGWSEAARVSGNSAQGGELTLIYKIASGGETSQSVSFSGPGGTGTSIMGAGFAVSGNSTIQPTLLSTVGSDSSWPRGSSNMGPVKGGFSSAASDALVLICAGKTAGFSTTGGNAAPGALSATTSDGETWNRAFTITGTSGDDCGMFLDYTALQGQPSITTKSWTQLTGVTSLTSGAGCGFMVSFVPTRVQAGVPPSITDLEDITLSVGSTLSFTPAVSAGSTPITWSKASGPSNITLDGTSGAFEWTALSTGDFVVLLKATNSHGSDTEDFVITAVSGGGAGVGNVSPVITHPGDQAVRAQERLSFVVLSTDSDGDPLAYSLSANAPSGTFIDTETGQFVWQPTGDQGPGVYPITVVVSDGQHESLSTFTVTVNDAIWTRIGGPNTQLGRVDPVGNSFKRI